MRRLVTVLSFGLVLFGLVPAYGTTVERMNVAALVDYSELILVGRVVGVSDGFDSRNLPYTEITLQVEEAIKGSAGGHYRFRQFGLAAPRDLGDGRTYVGVSPDGWPTFTVGESIIIFLHEKTSLGFQSSTGLLQGKFRIEDGRVANDIANMALFDGVSVDPMKLTAAEFKMLETMRGSCAEQTFRGFVRKAVAERWFVGDAGKRSPQRGANRDQR